MSQNYTPAEMMTVAAARGLSSQTVCFVGIGIPSAAANLARLTHAPDVVLIYESGTIGAKPQVLPLSIGDGELADTADTVVSVPEVFRYWLQGGRVDVGFLGAAQVDKVGRLNTTVIGGSYEHPKLRLPGAGGAPEAEQAQSCRAAFVCYLFRLCGEPGEQSSCARPGTNHPCNGSLRNAIRPCHARTGVNGAAPGCHGRAGACRDRLGASRCRSGPTNGATQRRGTPGAARPS